MVDRFRLDWENLTPLPRKLRDVGATRDDLAARKFNMGKAKHKGRCHISNQKRRQIALERARAARKTAQIKAGSARNYHARVRAYWLGEAEEHP